MGDYAVRKAALDKLVEAGAVSTRRWGSEGSLWRGIGGEGDSMPECANEVGQERAARKAGMAGPQGHERGLRGDEDLIAMSTSLLRQGGRVAIPSVGCASAAGAMSSSHLAI